MMNGRISIIIPTLRRLSGLQTALESVLAQTGVDLDRLEVVVVDNDREASARETVERLAGRAAFPVRYVHEPEPGVASARNAALGVATGDWIAFLDDDEEAPPGWLSALTAAQARFDADVVFGPVRGRAPPHVVRHRAYLERFFSREGPAEAGVIEGYYGCGDSLIRRAALPDRDSPFAVERNHSGGEDDLLFGRMKTAGARFAWAPEAWVWEDPAAGRLSLTYTIRRAFAYGQGPSEACAAADPPDRMGLARWMVIGAVQALVFGVLAGFWWLLGSPRFAFTLDRAARGLGKVLWWNAFRSEFYGRSAA
jgi:glycosyltransferase involved in cell wall biosynthesis